MGLNPSIVYNARLRLLSARKTLESRTDCEKRNEGTSMRSDRAP
jgi:hypothetical protein